jgi:hypothetical protein
MVISTQIHGWFHTSRQKKTAEYTVIPKDNIALEKLNFHRTILSSAVRETEDRTLLKKIRATIWPPLKKNACASMHGLKKKDSTIFTWLS